MSTHSIIALFESESIRRESFQYATALARRMNSWLTILVILPLEASINSRGGVEAMLQRAVQTRSAFENLVAATRSEDIIADIVVRIGNPKSELVKFLAETGQPGTIVWGSAPNLMKRRDHWLVRMKDVLTFPIVTPFVKSMPQSTRPII